MSTQFEIAMWGRPYHYLRSAAEEAFTEIHRLEGQLSLYREDTEIFELNFRGSKVLVPLDPRVYSLIKLSRQISEMTMGAFDITMLPLLSAWGFVGKSGEIPSENELTNAKKLAGFQHLVFDDEHHAVGFDMDGVNIDLGAIGKGYAVDQAAEVIRELAVPGALIHAGTSTIYAVGNRSDGSPWPIAIQDPMDEKRHLAIAELTDMSLSVSAPHGKSFQVGDRRYGHVIDPRTGEPTRSSSLAAVMCGSATESDAFSTALLVAGSSLFPTLRDHGVNGAFVLNQEHGAPVVHSFGTLSGAQNLDD